MTEFPICKPGLVSAARNGSAIVLTLTRTAQANALSPDLIDALAHTLDFLEDDPSETLIFVGEGKGFCSGFDLSTLDNETDATLLARFVQIEVLLQRIASYSKRTACLAHGFAYGAGADILIACDHRVATPDCRLAFPGRRFGIVLGTARLGTRLGSLAALNAITSDKPLSALSLEGAIQIATIDEWTSVYRQLAEPLACDAKTRADLLRCVRPQSNDESDLVALVRSASRPGLHQRLIDYRNATRRRTAKPS